MAIASSDGKTVPVVLSEPGNDIDHARNGKQKEVVDKVEEEEEEEEEDDEEDEESVEEVDASDVEDDLAEIDTKNIIGRRTRGIIRDWQLEDRKLANSSKSNDIAQDDEEDDEEYTLED